MARTLSASPRPIFSRARSRRNLVVLAVAAASAAARNPRWPASLYRAISVTGGLAALCGIAQYFGIDPFLDPALYTPATMGNAIYFAACSYP